MKRTLKAWLIVLVAMTLLAGPAQSDVTYTYDGLGRLIKTDYTSAGSAIDYNYDPAGNRSTISVTGTGVSQFGAVDDAVGVDYAAMQVFSPFANDTGGIAPITLSIVTQPTNGVAIIAANGADIEYTPNAGYQGADSFTYSGIDINGPASGATVSLTIAAPVVFDITADASGTEGAGILFTVTKTGAVSSTQTVDVASVAGTASSADITDLSTTLTFLSSETSKTFTVMTTDDSMYEGQEAFTVQLSNPSSGAALGTAVRTGTIIDNDGINFSIADTSISEGGVLSFVVTKTGTASMGHSFTYAVSNGTASAGDYTASSGTVSFTAADVTQTVTVATTQDTINELDETVIIDLSAPSNGASLIDSQAIGTIVDDDAAPAFSVNDVAIGEGGILTFTVTKSGTTALTHDVTYASANSSAVSVTDYTAATGSLSFAPGEASKTVAVTSLQDIAYEGNETFLLNLSAPTNGATLADGQGVGTINDNDTAPAFSVNNVSVSEGGTLSFTVTKSGSTALAHNVNYATANNTAIASDYTATSGTLSFASGDTSKTVSVVTTQNGSYENNEVLRLNLSSATNGATISDSQGNGTINNDDPAPSFAINNVTKVEGQNLTFTITKTGSTLLTHKVNYATANNSAIAGSDYVSTSGLRSFAYNVNSRTFTITGIQDSVVEATENFRVNLSNATAGAVIGDSQGIGYITNDDVANSAPNAVNDLWSGVQFNTWNTFNVRANDSDPDGDSTTITGLSGVNGTANIINNGTMISYKYSGNGSEGWFTYTLSDGSLTDTAYVSVFIVGGGGLPLF